MNKMRKRARDYAMVYNFHPDPRVRALQLGAGGYSTEVFDFYYCTVLLHTV